MDFSMHFLRKIKFAMYASSLAICLVIASFTFFNKSVYAQTEAISTPAETEAPIKSSAVFTEINPTIIDNYSLSLSTKINLQLDSELRQALSKGLPLYFTLDARFYQKRGYWFDKLIAQQSLTWMIHYNVLLREWRIERGPYVAKGYSLEDAIDLITTNDDWKILLNEPMDSSKKYYGKVRLRLDTSLLSRPFQISAFSDSSAWSFSSSWAKFQIHH
ncbi:DUF4390 domain-containing protein [Taylorella equigenitalis]|nr:DUF4390 domain-containing protein [Taylorella equigenitalis]